LNTRPFEFERHHRGDDGDAALAFDLHPVGTGVAPLALGLDWPARLMAPPNSRISRQRGLAGVRMRDDRKGAPARDLLGERRAGRRFGGESKVVVIARALAGKPGRIKQDQQPVI